ncbi:MAG: hypothetical protein ATN36_07875 [Epulopiscium sp. Nele67-Bin005]|nr:MAG: hypothetical protein ATN36_07875 [Epulopiscium sp. Nele67-Bin005]
MKKMAIVAGVLLLNMPAVMATTDEVMATADEVMATADEVTAPTNNFTHLTKGMWLQRGGESYYCNEWGVTVTGINVIEGKLYNFGDDGKQVTGLLETSEGLQIFLPEGTAEGLVEYLEDTYFVGSDYMLQTGMQEFNGQTYYFDNVTYKLSTGIVHDGENFKLLVDTGSVSAGIVEYQGDYYFIDEYLNLHSGLQQVDEKVFLFDQETFVMKTGWQEVNGEQVYIDPEVGLAVDGWTTIGGETYYFQDGSLANGIVDINGLEYAFENGVGKFGLQNIDGNYYYFLDEGGTYKGGCSIDGQSYFFKEDGIGAIGYYTIEGKLYYFYEDATLATNTTIGMYTANEYGALTKMAANWDNLGYHLESILDQYGYTPERATAAVRDLMKYKYYTEPATTVDGAIFAINNKNGACYHHAALAYELITYMGYEAHYIVGIGRLASEHAWVAVYYPDEGWFYHDPIYQSARYTEQQIINLGYKWDRNY